MNFTSPADFAIRAEPGQTFTYDEAQSKKRAITTYVMLEREGNTAQIEHIVTCHRGKPELPRDLGRCYDSVHRTIPTEITGTAVISQWGMHDGKTYRLNLVENVARYSATNLRAAHELALQVYRA